MTSVTFFRSGTALCGFRASGHSGYAEAGSDIVCAAVSALCQTAEMGLRKIAKVDVSTRMDEDKGFLELTVPHPDHDSQVILSTLEEGIKDIASQYPRYVRTTYLERRQST